MQKLLQGKSPNTSVRSGALIHRPGPVRIKTPMSDKYLSFADLQISKRRFLLTVHWNCRTHWRPSEQAIKVRELVGTDDMKGVPLLYYNLSFLIGGGVLLHGTLKKKKRQSSTPVPGNQEEIQGGRRERSWTFGLQQKSQEWKQQQSSGSLWTGSLRLQISVDPK